MSTRPTSPEGAQAEEAPNRTALLLVFLTIFIDFLGIGILQPVAPYLVGKFRPDAAAIGWIASAYSIAQFFAAPMLGSISDRTGRRPVLLYSLLGTSVGYLLFAVANSYPMMIVARVLEGFTGGAVTTAQAYIADVSTPKTRARSFGLIGVAIGLGFIFGPGLGGLLAKIDIHAPVYVTSALALLNAISAYFLLPESLKDRVQTKIQARDLDPFRRIGGVLADSRIGLLCWGFFIFQFAFSGFTGIFTKFVKERFNYTPDQAGQILFVVGMMLLLVQGVVIRPVVARFGELKPAWAGLAIGAVGLASIPFVRESRMLYLTQSILAFGVALASPNLRALISNAVARTEQGRVIGATQGLMSLALILGPLAASYLFDHLNYDAPFVTSALLFLVAIALLIASPQPAAPAAVENATPVSADP